MAWLTFSRLSFFYTHIVLKIYLKVPEAEIHETKHFPGEHGERDREAADDSDKEVTYSNCSTKKLTDTWAGISHVIYSWVGCYCLICNILSLSSSLLR